MNQPYFFIFIYLLLAVSPAMLNAQPGDLQINMTVSPEISPCAPSVLLQFQLTNESNANISDIQLAFDLPTGIRHRENTQAGIALISGSGTGNPGFSVGTLPPFGSIQFSFEVASDCALVAGQNTILVELNYNGQNYQKSIPNLNIRIPALNIVNSDNLFYTGMPGDTFTRNIQISNGIFGDIFNLYIISEHAENGVEFLNANPPYSIVTLSDGRTAFWIHPDYFDTFGNGNGVFDQGDGLLVFKETVRIIGCSGGAGSISVVFGCEDHVVCNGNQDSEITNVTVDSGNSNLEWQIATTQYPGFCTPGAITVTVSNTGTIGALNVIVEPGIQTYSSASAPARNDCVPLSMFRIGGTSLLPEINNYSGYGIDLSQLNTDPDGNGGLADLDGDGLFNDLPAGESFTLIITIELLEACLGTTFFNHYFGMSTYITGGCVPTSGGGEFTTAQNFRTYPGYQNVMDNLAIEYSDQQTINVQFQFRRENETGFFNNCLGTGATVYSVVIPDILDFPPNFTVTANNVTLPYELRGDTVIFQVPGYEPNVNMNLIVECMVESNGNSPFCPISGSLPKVYHFSYWADYYCDINNCDVFYRIYNGNSKAFVVDCDEIPAISAPGVKTTDFTARRMTLGWTDESLTEKVDPVNPVIRLDRAYLFDFVKFTIPGHVTGAGIFDTSYLELLHYSGNASFPRFYTVTDTLHFYDQEQGMWFTCANLPHDSVIGTGGLHAHYYALSPLFQPGGCLEGMHFTENDSVRFEVTAQIANAPSLLSPIPLLEAGLNFRVDSDTLRCGRHGALLSIANPFYDFDWQQVDSEFACDTLTLKIILNQGGNNSNLFDVFPGEFRPYAIFDSLHFTMPSSLRYIPGSAKIKYEWFNAAQSNIQTSTISVPGPLVLPASTSQQLLLFNNQGNYPNVDVLRQNTINEFQIQLIPDCIPDVEDILSRVYFTRNYYAHDIGYSRPTFIPFQFPDLFPPGTRTIDLLQQEYSGSSDTAAWRIELCNEAASASGLTETIPNNWIALEVGEHGILPLWATDLLHPQDTFRFVPADTAGYFWAFMGDLAGNDCRVLEIAALSLNCDSTAITMSLGYACHNYPAHPEISYQSCNDAKIEETLFIIPKPALLDIDLVLTPVGQTPLCEGVTYEFAIINGQTGHGKNVEVRVQLPPGSWVIPGTSQLRIGAGSYLSVPDSVISANSNGLVSWHLNQFVNSPIYTSGLVGILDAPDNTLHLTFQLETNCDYVPENTLSYAVLWENACGGSQQNSANFFGAPLQIIGAPTAPNTYQIAATQNPVNACEAGIPLRIKIKNMGGAGSGVTSSNEFVRLQLPEGTTYEVDTYVPVYNMPAVSMPEVMTSDSANWIYLDFPDGVIAGDSLIFEITLGFDDEILNYCGIYPTIVEIRQFANIPCTTAPNGNCSISFLLDKTGILFQVEKNRLMLENGTTQAFPHTNTTERWEGQITIRNQASFDAHGVLNGKVYLDADENGSFDPNVDSLIYTQTISIESLAPGMPTAWNFDLIIAAIHACRGILFVLDSAENCQCSSNVLYVPPPTLRNVGSFEQLCPQENMELGNIGMNLYAYVWTPNIHLSNAAISNPVFINQNLVGAGDRASFAYNLLTTRIGGCTSMDTVTLEVSALHIELASEYDYNGYDVSCFGRMDGQINAAISGGFAPLLYQWSNGVQQEATINGIGAGNYTLMITDQEGCQSSKSISIAAPPPVVLSLQAGDFSGYNTSCHNSQDGYITALAGGGIEPYLFEWENTAETDSMITMLIAGTYVVNVTDLNGCPITDSVTLVSPPHFTTTDTTLINPNCPGGTDGSISVMLTGGVFPYFHNDTTLTTPEFSMTGLDQGNYTFSITDLNGCLYEASFELTEQVSMFELLTMPVSCHGGSDGGIEATALTGFSPYSYAWSHGPTLPLVTHLSAGSYLLTITDSNNCSYQFIESVTEPPQLEVFIAPDHISCAGGSDGRIALVQTGGVPPYGTYLNGTVTSFPVNNLLATSYILRIVDSNGCLLDTVLTLEQPQPLSLFGNIEHVTCNGFNDGGISTNGNGGIPPYFYQWSNGATSTTLDSLSAGNFQLTLSDENGCEITSVFIVTEPAVPNPELQITDPSCFNYTDGALFVEEEMPGSHLFSLDGNPFQSGNNFINLAAGQHQLSLKDTADCIYHFEFVLNTAPEHFIEIFEDGAIRLGDSIELSITSQLPLTHILWVGGDSIRCDTCPVTFVRPNYSQQYQVAVISEKGCANNGAVYIVVDRTGLVYIPNVFSPNGDEINDRFTIFGGNALQEIEMLQIFTRWGEQVFIGKQIPPNDPNQGWDGKFRQTLMSSGVYVYYTKVRLIDGTELEFSGDITLTR